MRTHAPPLCAASEGLGLIVGSADEADAGSGSQLQAAVGLPRILSVQGGQIADMDTIADALYGRG